MKCPKCGEGDTKVIESRLSNDGRSVRRRRACTKCQHRYTTYEKEELLTLQVKKRDGSFDVFNREKLISALSMACRKRKISIEQIETIVSNIEASLRSSGERSISSKRIGDEVMARLRETDHVAYVRFASIYKDFKDPEEFLRELRNLQHPKPQPSQPTS